MFCVTLMLRKAKSIHWGTAHNYPKMILANLLVLAHWTNTDYVAKHMMETNISCVNEEMGEMTFSILSRSVLGDQHKANIDHMNDLYALLPVYRAIDQDVLNDARSPSSLSWRHKINPQGDEVKAVEMFFRQKLTEVSKQNFQMYDGSVASYKSRVSAAGHLTQCVSPPVWVPDVLEMVPPLFEEIKDDITGYWLHRYTNVWTVGKENDIHRSIFYEGQGDESSDESERDEYFGTEPPAHDESVQWGADWDDCQVGVFALSRGMWPNGSEGVCVHKVKSINAEVELDENEGHVYHSFMGREYQCTDDQTNYARTVKSNTKWWTPSGHVENEKVMSYDVLAYFPQLGKNGVLPPEVLQVLKDQYRGQSTFWTRNA